MPKYYRLEFTASEKLIAWLVGRIDDGRAALRKRPISVAAVQLDGEAQELAQVICGQMALQGGEVERH